MSPATPSVLRQVKPWLEALRLQVHFAAFFERVLGHLVSSSVRGTLDCCIHSWACDLRVRSLADSLSMSLRASGGALDDATSIPHNKQVHHMA